VSDFLGTLVARSLSAPLALPLVQPRLPSRFETEAPAPPAFDEREVEGTPRVEREPPAARADPAPTPATPTPRTRHAADEPRAPTRREARDAHETPLPRTRRRERDEAETLPPRPRRREEPREPSGTRHLRPPAPALTPPAASAVTLRDHAPAATPAPATTRHESRTRTVVVERERVEGRTPEAPAVSRARVVPVVTLAPPEPRAEPPSRAPSLAAPAEPAPVIQVTIGRIEVRARETRAAPAREPAAAGPLTSLEDYLARRRRQGGGAS
jgi:hypothetical protein